MPVFYSVNEAICKQWLRPIPEHAFEELPHYGDECDEAVLFTKNIPTLVRKASVDQKTTFETQLTFAVVWITAAELVVILAFKCHRYCQLKKQSEKKKRVKFVRSDSNSALTNEETKA